jgi:hypothetical protein
LRSERDQRQTQDLPQGRAWWTVYRLATANHAFEPVGLNVGTSSGAVWASTDEGESWWHLAENLPQIFAVETGVLA